VPTTKSTLFVVSKDEWDTKEGPGECTIIAKGTSWAEVTSNSKSVVIAFSSFLCGILYHSCCKDSKT